MSVKSTFLIFFISSLAKVYLCAWPADHLLSAVSYVYMYTKNSLIHLEINKLEINKNILSL